MKHFKTTVCALAIAVALPAVAQAATVSTNTVGPLGPPPGDKGQIVITGGAGVYEETFTFTVLSAGTISGVTGGLALGSFQGLVFTFAGQVFNSPVFSSFSEAFVDNQEFDITVAYANGSSDANFSFNLEWNETPPPVVPLPAGLPLLMAGLAFLRARQKAA